MGEQVIAVDGLEKAFGRVLALRGLDLHVERGQVHGFLGPNGAGKSTTIRVLLGLLRADAGRVRLLDGDPWRDVVELHRRLAYVPGDVSLWPGLSGGEAIDLLGAMRGSLDDARRAELVERFELDVTKKGRQYSKGNRQKVALVAALASDAELLILDEPTSGLDPLMEVVFQQVVAEAAARGVTVLLSSHILSEVEALADRVSIIREGRVVETGSLADLRGRARSHVTAVLQRPPADADLTMLQDVRVVGNRLTAVADADHLSQAMARLSRLGLTALTVEPPSLEAMFLRHYDAERRPVADPEDAQRLAGAARGAR